MSNMRDLPFDVSRCSSKTCPHREQCARATSFPEAMRLICWFGFDPWCARQQRHAQDCLYFISNE